MRFVYAILAHDGFEQLERLIQRLLADAPDDRVCLHVDAKAQPPATFLAALSPAIRARVEQVARPVVVHWGHHSQCAAMARLLDLALAAPADVIHLLSGRDWPLMSRARIAADIAAAAPGACFVDACENDMAHRMNGWCFGAKVRSDPTALSWRIAVARSRFSRFADRELKRAGVVRSEPLGPWRRASQWWSLPEDAARCVRDAFRTLGASGRLRFTQCSDEHVALTALIHAGFGDRIVPARRLIDFPPAASSPRWLTAADLDSRPADRWFGRKFSTAVDPAFLAV